MSEPLSVFDALRAVDVSGHTETKKVSGTELTYLSWPFAWAETKKRYPDVEYHVIKQSNGLPYTYDELTGYMVNTTVTINGITHEMWLPVMDGANKAMKSEPYEYATKYGTKRVEAATMFDINTTIMRCLVKNLAMFGMGLELYTKSDMPLIAEEKKEKVNTEAVADEPKTPLINPKQVTQITEMCKKSGVDPKIIFEKFCIDSLAKLTVLQYAYIAQNWSKEFAPKK